MAYQDKKQTQAPGQEEELRPEEELVPEQNLYGMPNSTLTAMPTPPPPPGTPNSVMREMLEEQDHDAEGEAALYSAGYAGNSANLIRRQMSGHPDFGTFSAGFQPDPESSRRNVVQRITAGHERVHTIRDDAAPARVSRSAPYGTIQRNPFERFRNFVHRHIHHDDEPAAPVADHDIAAAPDPAAPRDAGPAVPAAVPPAPAADRARRRARQRRQPVKTQAQLQNELQQIETTMRARQAEIPAMMAAIQPLQQQLQEPQKLSRMLQNDPQKLQRLLEQQRRHETQRLKKQREGMAQVDMSVAVRPVVEGETDTRIYRLEKLQQYQQQDLEIQPQQVTDLGDEILDIIYDIRHLQEQDRDLQPGPVDDLAQRAGDLEARMNKLRDDLRAARAMRKDNREYLTQLQAGLPDPKDVFNLDETTGEGKRRWRMSSEAVNIDGLVQYYIAWCDIHGLDRGAQGDITAPVMAGLAAANESLFRIPGRSNQPFGNGDQDGQGAGSNGYHKPNEAAAEHRWRLGTADAIRNAGNLVNAGGKFGVLMDHDRVHGPMEGKDPKTGKPYGRWDLVHSRGSYGTYTEYVAPIAGAALGAYGGVTGAMNAGFSAYDTYRKHQNAAIGGSRLDAAQSGLDTLSALGGSASGFWSAAEGIASIGGPAADLGGAAVGIPLLSMGTGLISAVSGGMESERARRAGNQIDDAKGRFTAITGGRAAPPAAAGKKSDQQQMEEAFEHTKMVTTLHHTSGALKAAAGSAQVAAGVATLAGGAPVAAAFQGAAAILSIAKVAFERGFKHHMRKKVVGTYYNINWSDEMNAVRAMIRTYNSSFNLRDKDVREIILKAHGSQDTTRTAAFKGINRKRAKFLIDTANNDGHVYQNVAGMVVEAMGIHKVGNSFTDGAIDLLAEKLSGA